jgi:hypothetical protein
MTEVDLEEFKEAIGILKDRVSIHGKCKLFKPFGDCNACPLTQRENLCALRVIFRYLEYNIDDIVSSIEMKNRLDKSLIKRD